MMNKTTLALGLIALGTTVGAFPALAERSTLADQKELSVTVYNDNRSLVREVRSLKLDKGIRELEFSDVAANIDPTSVSLRSLSAPQDLHVLEQNYEYDLMTPQKLLDKYVGQEVLVDDGKNMLKATLLSTNEGQVYKIGDQIYLQPPGKVILPRVPDNLVARPTLKWMLENTRGSGEQQTEVSYLTSGLSWRANYVLVLNADQSRSDLNGWVTLDNQSGAAFNYARLTLVAGDVNRVRSGPILPRAYGAMKSAAPEGDQFAERTLFEYHSYQLNRPTTLKENQSKQISLLSAADVSTRKLYHFETQAYPIWQQDPERRSEKVNVYLELQNAKANHLGIPLPKGTVRVYQQDPDKHLQFIGEDAIEHTPRDEKVKIKMGQAFDLVGERRQVDYKVLGDRLVEATYEVTLRNHKDEPVVISAVEHLAGDWEITRNTVPFTKLDATTVEFPVRVPANQEQKVTYTVRTRY